MNRDNSKTLNSDVIVGGFPASSIKKSFASRVLSKIKLLYTTVKERRLKKKGEGKKEKEEKMTVDSSKGIKKKRGLIWRGVTEGWRLGGRLLKWGFEDSGDEDEDVEFSEFLRNKNNFQGKEFKNLREEAGGEAKELEKTKKKKGSWRDWVQLPKFSDEAQ